MSAVAESFPLQVGERLAEELRQLGVPEAKALLWATAGGAQKLRLHRVSAAPSATRTIGSEDARHLEGTSPEESERPAVFVWEVHRQGTAQVRIADWAATAGMPAEARADLLRELVSNVVADAELHGVVLVKAQSTPGDVLLEAALQATDFVSLPPPLLPTSPDLVSDSPLRVLHGWVRGLDATAVAAAPMYRRQQTDFTCGPVSFLMAAGESPADGFTPGWQNEMPSGIEQPSPQGTSPLHAPAREELELWREATYVVGCGPFGLAAAAARRGSAPTVWVDHDQPLLADHEAGSLSSPEVRRAIHFAHLADCRDLGIPVILGSAGITELRIQVTEGAPCLLVIDELILNGATCGHWVLVWACMDDTLEDPVFLIHDPWTDEEWQESWVECWGMAVSASNLEDMAHWRQGDNPGRAFLALAEPRGARGQHPQARLSGHKHHGV